MDYEVVEKSFIYGFEKQQEPQDSISTPTSVTF